MTATKFASQKVTDLSPKALATVDGFSPIRRAMNALRQIQVSECASIWNKFMHGKISPFLMREAACPNEAFAFNELHRLAPHIFQEAMTRSDFLNLTTYVLDRMMLENFPSIPSTYQEVCRIHPNVRDFRNVERWVTDGGEGVYQKVGELEGFERGKVDTGKVLYSVAKYEGGDQISWEAVINDDMDMFRDLPQRLTIGGKRTIEQFYLQMIAGATGPNTAAYGDAIALPSPLTGTVKNTIDLSGYSGVKNPPLTLNNLIMAAGLFMNLATAEGRPINIGQDELVVVVGDGMLYQTLLNIVNTNQIVTQLLGGKASATAGGYPDVALMAKNWIAGKIRPVFAPELRNIITSNGATSWWLFCRPGVSRPAVELGFLTGYDTPQLYRKLPNTVRVGGGSADELGDFETMATEFKALIVMGGTRVDPRVTMASNGAGS